ncbi:hydrogenase maturation nickel metallochaperone HypA [Patescibacteria group bacterium]|nr:hydrogenase maturation nickel metallochaperone HypA [Patescibacteria group bacterium]
MHDWHLADEIFKTILDYANKNNFNTVKKIKLELGGIIEHGQEINSDNLIFNIKLLGEKTIIKDAKIKIKRIKGDKWRLVLIEGE